MYVVLKIGRNIYDNNLKWRLALNEVDGHYHIQKGYGDTWRTSARSLSLPAAMVMLSLRLRRFPTPAKEN